MKKANIITFIVGGLLIAAFCMMFLPQIALGIDLPTFVSVETSLDWQTAFFGGEVIVNNFRVGLFNGTTLGFVGYILAACAGGLTLLSILSKNKGLRTALKVISLLTLIIAVVFIWITVDNWKNVNDIVDGQSKSLFTINKISYATGPVVAGSLSVAGVVGLLIAIGADYSKKSK